MEFSEFTSIDYRGGYSSIFGDGCEISIDICQHCLKETLGKWLTVGESQYAVGDHDDLILSRFKEKR